MRIKKIPQGYHLSNKAEFVLEPQYQQKNLIG